jgi:hypothetical protein
MTKRIFSYPATAEQEADSVRQLLKAHHIEFYETPASRWGFTQAAIWIKHDTDADNVRRLLEQHHQKFAAQARQDYQRETGYDPNAPLAVKFAFTVKHLLKRKVALLVLAFGLFLLYLYLSLFLSLFNN